MRATRGPRSREGWRASSPWRKKQQAKCWFSKTKERIKKVKWIVTIKTSLQLWKCENGLPKILLTLGICRSWQTMKMENKISDNKNSVPFYAKWKIAFHWELLVRETITSKRILRFIVRNVSILYLQIEHLKGSLISVTTIVQDK